jgi:3-isopropylmalate/(R)-2-methylmalate dehydratase large subunit
LVHETVRFVLTGRKRADVSAKDVMLKILSTDYMKEGKGIGQVLEFAGEGLAEMSIDERATLTNMAVEAGGTTGIIEPDEVTLEYLTRTRGLDAEEVRKGFLKSDADAEYAATSRSTWTRFARWWRRRATRATASTSANSRKK